MTTHTRGASYEPSTASVSGKGQMDLTHLKATVPEGDSGEAELERFQDASEQAFLQGWFWLGGGGSGCTFLPRMGPLNV